MAEENAEATNTDASDVENNSDTSLVNDPKNIQEITFYVQTLLQNMQDNFQSLTDEIINRIDEMASRVDELEKNITEIMAQASIEEKPV